MDKNHALDAFAALSQSTRLDVFRLLIKAGDAGMSAGGRPELCQPVINELACAC